MLHSADLIVALSFWFLGFLVLFRIPRPSAGKQVRGPRPMVSVVIPARHEQDNLPVILSSLKAQDLSNTDISVVVDESDEGTAEAARKHGARTIVAPPRPPGWLGKPWSCYQGAAASTGDILVFLDADVRLEEGGLSCIVDACVEKGIVSVQPYHRMERPYEEFSAFFNIIGMAGMGTFTVLGSRVQPLGLFGPCIALRREIYDEIGGHSAVKGEVVEDLALGAKLKERKYTPTCFGGRGAISFRMYSKGFRDLIEGWSKGFATGAVKTYLPLLVLIVLWMGGGISATRWLIGAVASQSGVSVVAWGSAYLAYCLQIYWMLFRLGNFKILTALLYPVPLAFFMAVFLYSVFLIFVRRRVRWKGATLDLKKNGARVP
jgi:4,4'-diaponeurosporenoate glycosyltransferase